MKFFAAIKTNKSALHISTWKCLQDALLNEKKMRKSMERGETIRVSYICFRAWNISGMVH